MPKVFYLSTYLCISLYIKLSLLFIIVHLNFDFLFNQFLLCLKIMYIIPGLWGTEFFTYIFLSWFNYFRADITTSKSVLRVSYFFFYIFHPLVFYTVPWENSLAPSSNTLAIKLCSFCYLAYLLSCFKVCLCLFLYLFFLRSLFVLKGLFVSWLWFPLCLLRILIVHVFKTFCPIDCFLRGLVLSVEFDALLWCWFPSDI